MSKYTVAERQTVKSIITSLSIKRIPTEQILDEVFRQTGKRLSRSGLFRIKQSIKKDSYQWYEKLREGQFDYIYEFNQRVAEITDLQKRHYEIADSPKESTTVKQASLAELHRLNITLSNYFDVAPSIIQVGVANKIGNSIPTAQQDNKDDIIV
jgi:hypothetical protein